MGESVKSYYAADGVGLELRTTRLEPSEDFGIWILDTGAGGSIEDGMNISLGPADAVRLARDILDEYGQDASYPREEPAS